MPIVQRAGDARLVAFGASAALAAGIAGLPGARLQPFEVVDEHEQVGGRAISVAKPSTQPPLFLDQRVGGELGIDQPRRLLGAGHG